MTLPYKTVIQTIYFDPIEIPDNELVFKLDILKNNQEHITGQLYRQERYRFKVAFDDIHADKAIYVLDFHTLPDLEEKVFSHQQQCIDYVFNELQKRFA